MHCLVGFEFLDQLGWGLLLQEGGVASFLAPGGIFNATHQWQDASISVCARVRHMAHFYQMCAALDGKGSWSLALPYLAIVPRFLPSLLFGAHFPFFPPCP